MNYISSPRFRCRREGSLIKRKKRNLRIEDKNRVDAKPKENRETANVRPANSRSYRTHYRYTTRQLEERTFQDERDVKANRRKIPLVLAQRELSDVAQYISRNIRDTRAFMRSRDATIECPFLFEARSLRTRAEYPPRSLSPSLDLNAYGDFGGAAHALVCVLLE